MMDRSSDLIRFIAEDMAFNESAIDYVEDIEVWFAALATAERELWLQRAETAVSGMSLFLSDYVSEQLAARRA